MRFGEYDLVPDAIGGDALRGHIDGPGLLGEIERDRGRGGTADVDGRAELGGIIAGGELNLVRVAWDGDGVVDLALGQASNRPADRVAEDQPIAPLVPLGGCENEGIG